VSDYLPNYHKNKIINDKDVQYVLQNVTDQVKMVRATYPLLAKMSMDYFSDAEKNDFVDYLNSK
jgi:hypothetical protein